MGVFASAFKDAGFGTDTPMEAYPGPGKYVASHDLSRPEVLAELEKCFKMLSVHTCRAALYIAVYDASDEWRN